VKKSIRILKKPTGSVWFRFYKFKIKKTKPNRIQTKKIRKNQAKPEKTKPNRKNRAKQGKLNQTGLNRFLF